VLALWQLVEELAFGATEPFPVCNMGTKRPNSGCGGAAHAEDSRPSTRHPRIRRRSSPPLLPAADRRPRQRLVRIPTNSESPARSVTRGVRPKTSVKERQRDKEQDPGVGPPVSFACGIGAAVTWRGNQGQGISCVQIEKVAEWLGVLVDAVEELENWKQRRRRQAARPTRQARRIWTIYTVRESSGDSCMMLVWRHTSKKSASARASAGMSSFEIPRGSRDSLVQPCCFGRARGFLTMTAWRSSFLIRHDDCVAFVIRHSPR